eukprot:scaffold70256_cov66-Attheya_sp.AAC.3
MTGKPKPEILKYFITVQGMSLLDTKNHKLAPRTLESLLRAGITLQDAPVVAIDQPPRFIKSFAEESVMTIDDANSRISKTIA